MGTVKAGSFILHSHNDDCISDVLANTSSSNTDNAHNSLPAFNTLSSSFSKAKDSGEQRTRVLSHCDTTLIDTN